MIGLAGHPRRTRDPRRSGGTRRDQLYGVVARREEAQRLDAEIERRLPELRKQNVTRSLPRALGGAVNRLRPIHRRRIDGRIMIEARRVGDVGREARHV